MEGSQEKLKVSILAMPCSNTLAKKGKAIKKGKRRRLISVIFKTSVRYIVEVKLLKLSVFLIMYNTLP